MEIKVCINGLGHMTKMAVKPIYDINLKNLLQNQESSDFEALHPVFGTEALQSFYKYLPWVDIQ